MKKFLISATMFLAIALSFAITANARKVGGYKTAATDEARVVAAAEFAVTKRVEQNTEQEELRLDRWIKPKLKWLPEQIFGFA